MRVSHCVCVSVAPCWTCIVNRGGLAYRAFGQCPKRPSKNANLAPLISQKAPFLLSKNKFLSFNMYITFRKTKEMWHVNLVHVYQTNTYRIR